MYTQNPYSHDAVRHDLTPIKEYCGIYQSVLSAHDLGHQHSFIHLFILSANIDDLPVPGCALDAKDRAVNKTHKVLALGSF